MMVRIYFLLFLTLFSFNALSQWVEIAGKAYIGDSISDARDKAINNALNKARHQFGTRVFATQQLNQGKFESNTQLADAFDSDDVELLDEYQSSDTLTVTVRLFVDSSHTRSPLPTRSAIMVSQANIADISQLNYGQLSGFPEQLSLKIAAAIDQYSFAAFAQPYVNERFNVSRDSSNPRTNRLPQWLGQSTESQYILIPNIVDMSVSNHSSIFSAISDADREFKLQLSLYHAISGERVWQRTYANTAEWEFSAQTRVAPQSNDFWGSDYGIMISRVLEQASQDINNVIQQRPLMGQVIAVEQDTLLVNLGRKHGIQAGDTLNVILKNDLPDRLQLIRIVAKKSKASVKVSQVTEHTAVVEWSNSKRMENIQINDLLIKP